MNHLTNSLTLAMLSLFLVSPASGAEKVQDQSAKPAPAATAPAAEAANLLEVTGMKPATPAELKTGDQVTVTIHYTNPGPNAVRIWAHPFTKGAERSVVGAFSDGSNTIPPGSGDVTRSFGYKNAGLADEVRVTMGDAETKALISTLNVPVKLTWTGASVGGTAPAQPGTPLVPDFGELAVADASLANPKIASEELVNPAMEIAIATLKGPAKLSPDREILLYANPGKNFKVAVTVHYKTPVPTKLAANLLLFKAELVPDEFRAELKDHHSETVHFDTESRPGYGSAEGEKDMTFDLIGRAPKGAGQYTFKMNVGLFDKQKWSTQNLKLYNVTLFTDKKLFDAAPALSTAAPAKATPAKKTVKKK
jgi:hypothetical protein